MAWTSPTSPYFVVSEVVTATKMNVLSDGLRYLKGLDGETYMENDVSIGSQVAGSNLGFSPARAIKVGTGTANSVTALQIEAHRSGSDAAIGTFAFVNLAASGADKRISNILASRENSDDSGNMRFFTRNAGTVGEAMRLDRAGNMGVGGVAPAARLHVLGAGGSVLFISCNAVDGTLQTPIAAGTVTLFGSFIGVVRNNTGGGFGAVNASIALGANFNVAVTDTITVSITGGGAVTVQRTAGTNATHQVLMWMFFK